MLLCLGNVTTICMHVCMHVCMYVCMYACMYACMHICMYGGRMCVHVKSDNSVMH